MTVILKTPSADRDLDFLWLRIVKYSVINASNFILAIEEKIELLLDFPDSGANCPQLGSNIQRLVSGDYLIYYFHRGQEVVILRVLDGRNKIGPELFGGAE
ncbi:MAG: type II toxin-antitoxin system RelE/ParE family toxin [Hyphomicrobiaceae bacterium]|nr:type II toxin-antitoxin system RelE/ParE family toxin [Hyphomicrobiaceae bacterium]